MVPYHTGDIKFECMAAMVVGVKKLLVIWELGGCALRLRSWGCDAGGSWQILLAGSHDL